MAKNNHLSKKFIAKQKEVLLTLRSKILNQILHEKHRDLAIESDQMIEEGDSAQVALELQVAFGIKERELRRLRQIEEALERIERGTYGICLEFDTPIEEKRLLKMPWASLCLEAAEEEERERKKRSQLA